MNLKVEIAALFFISSGSLSAHATSYNVAGIFDESMTGGINTEFHGSFDWNPTTLTVSNFIGTMNESMQGRWTADLGHDYMNFGPYTARGKSTDMWPTQNTFFGQLRYLNHNSLYMLTLDKNLIQSDNGSVHTATIFKEDTSNVYANGGYDGFASSFVKYGAAGMLADGNVPNENALFTVAFEHDNNGNITSLDLQNLNNNSALVLQMIYGDCSVGSLMNWFGDASACMAGEPTGTSAMAGTPFSLEISEVAAIPVPAAAWLFGASLVSLIAGIRKSSPLAA